MRAPSIPVAALALLVALPAVLLAATKTPPEATPAVSVLRAVRNGDSVAFQSSYSRRIREDPKQNDWKKNVKDARGHLDRLYGSYDLDKFEYSFAGDQQKGRLTIRYPDKKPITLAVVKEDGEWRLDER